MMADETQEHNSAGQSPEDDALNREAESYPLEGSEPSASAAEDAARALAQAAEWRDKYLRSIADFQNYQRRALQNEADARKHGISSVVQNVVNVMDHFDLALAHDPSKATAEQIVSGVKVIREELLKALTNCGVRVIAPKPNDEFQPGQHEAIMQQSAQGVEKGNVAMLFQPGYALGERIIRPAKVGIAP
jgi:molecular chaperone GrpE